MLCSKAEVDTAQGSGQLCVVSQHHFRVWPPAVPSCVCNCQPGLEHPWHFLGPWTCTELLYEGQDLPSGGVKMSAWLLLPTVLCHSWLQLILGRKQDLGKKTHHQHGYTSVLHLCCIIFLAQESSSKEEEGPSSLHLSLVASRIPLVLIILVEQSSGFKLGLNLQIN